MATPLLTTKLYIPPPRPNLVPRPRLLQRMDEGLSFGQRLMLVSAPAGFGKTTLVAEWICGIPREVAWISLDEGDNDPVQFLTYLIAALQQVDGNIGRTVQPMLRSPQVPPTQNSITALINELTAAGVPLVLVLDDYQLITSSVVHQALGFLLEHQPPSMLLVISTRQDPPLPLHRLRVRGQVTEIREGDLRFTVEETAAFLSQTMGLELPAEAIAALEARTEGWIAGVQLAAITMQVRLSQSRLAQSTLAGRGARGDFESFVASFAGDDRYVMDYLVAEVLQQQPEAVREFLRQTAILDRLSASLCNAVTGREDGQAILDRLDRTNLFLVPLDRRREWYRYHRLFAEVLRATLSEEEQVPLHRRAAGWYERQGLVRQAIHHALAYGSACKDWEDAERLVRLAAEETLYSGGLTTVSGWLDALPEGRVRGDGELAIYKAWVLALSGEIEPAEVYADAAEACLCQAEAPAADLGKLRALRSFLAVFGSQNYEMAIELAGNALRLLEQDQARWRVIALWSMAESQERTRNITEAISTLREARRQGRTLGSQVFATTVEIFLATTLHMHGERREAVAACQETIEYYTAEAGGPPPVIGMVLSLLGVLHYEANQLQEARSCLDRGLALSKQLALDSPVSYSLGFCAATLHAQGETRAALDAIQRAYELASRASLADADWCLAVEANIHLQQGDVAFVRRWAGAADLSPDDEPQYVYMERHLVYARLLIAQGRLPAARPWLARLECFLRERELYRWLITVYILQALVADRSGDRATAVERLSAAVELAAPEDYYRAFLDEDARLLTLLPDVRHVAAAFVDQLAAYAGISEPDQTVTMRSPLSQSLVEPLSERELEVLRLIAAGLSNREIAQELVIAVGTVKRHINNLYGKLGVGSRTQAIARARELGLL
jgi:LuxR family maltose regulon positive regulatory protein